jgi:exodeoxyribonuclease VII large subunit
VDSLHAERAEWRMTAMLQQAGQRLDDVSIRMETVITEQLRGSRQRVAGLGASVLRHDPRRGIAVARERLAVQRHHLDRAGERIVRAAAAHLQSIDARLHALSPLAVLDRGYALVQGSDGALIRSSAQLAAGDRITTRVSRGSFVSVVQEVHRPPETRQRKSRKK